MASPDVAGMIEDSQQGNEDPTQLGGDSQQQSQEPTGQDTGSPPIADPGAEGTNPWDAIDPKEPGPPRRDHERALHNARQQAADEILRGRSREDVTDALAFSELSRNPQSLMAWAFTQYPELAQAFQGPQAQPQQQPQGPELPKPVLDQYTGQYFYRSEDVEKLVQAKVDAAVGQVSQQFEQQLQPFAEREQQSREVSAANAQHDLYSATLPGFKDLLDNGHLGKELNRDRRTTVLSAYNKLYKEVYEPARRARERKELMDSLNKKAGAQTDGRPIGGTGQHPRKPQDFQQMRGQSGWDAAIAEAEAEAASS